MYCVKCGVELADSEKRCPLCGTVAYHPDIQREEAAPPFPKSEIVREEFNRDGILFILSVLFVIPLILTLVCDFSINSDITWSGYCVFSIAFGYIAAVLPLWFRSPNPVVFIPVDFVALGLLLFYINYTLDGGWFLPIALPIVCMYGSLVSAVVALVRYLRRGYLYIYGGALMLLGIFMPATEFLINSIFGLASRFVWSFYPLTVCFLLGIMLIIIAVCRPLRESLHKRFFI